MLLAIPVIDQLYFVCVPRFGQGDLDRRGRIAFFAGAAVWLYGPWWVTQLAAYGLGTRLVAAPDALGVLAPLALVGLLARSTAGRPAQVAATTAVVVTVAARSMPFNAALVVAAVSGIAAGTVVTRRNEGGADRW
jgi:predicted branched-subunit amino acid permease